MSVPSSISSIASVAAAQAETADPQQQAAQLARQHAEQRTNRRNTRVLAICQGLYTCAISIDLTLTALTGYYLAPDKRWATLPFALITVAGALVTWFAAFLIERLGRRCSFALGAASGALGGAISVWSVWHGYFWSFCLGTAGVGVFQAFAQYYRLAAADAAAPEHKSRAISAVLAGGVIAALLGPALAAWSRDWFASVPFAGAYLVVACLSMLSVLVLLLCYRNAAPAESAARVLPEEAALPARPLRELLRQPVLAAALANNVAGSAVMMCIMTATPLAALACQHGISDGATIIQWHLLGMYVPSFFAGRLIQRWGLAPLLLAGVLLNLACVLVAVSGNSLPAFYAALLCLGIGWNFMSVGGTTQLAQSYRPAERARVQGLAEFLRYAATAVATLAAGPLLQRYGWPALNLAMLPLLVLCVLCNLRWMLQRPARIVPASAA